MNRSGEDVIDEPTNLPARSGRPYEVDAMAIIRKRHAMLQELVAMAVASTHPSQWFDIGGKPRPTGAACEAMARACAVSMDIIQDRKIRSSDDLGKFYFYRYRCRFFLPGGLDSIDAEGTCSSRDQFLGTQTGLGRPLSEINEDDIMKAGLTNCRVNGISQLLGVRDMTWDRLEQLGIKRSETGKVNFKTGSRGGGGGGSFADEPLKFGPGKGKRLDELTDSQLDHYRKSFTRELDDPEKEKYHSATSKRLEALEAEAQRRSGHDAKKGDSKSVDTPPPAAPPDEETQKRVAQIVEMLESAGITTTGHFLTFARDVAKANNLSAPASFSDKQPRAEHVGRLSVDLQNAILAQLKLMVK